MNLNNFKEKPLSERKAGNHLKSWREEIENSVGRSPRELGIYNRRQIEESLRNLGEETLALKEFSFIQEIKRLNPEAGVYLVGGSVRDAILKRAAKDLDLVINRIDPVELVDLLMRYGKVTFDRQPKADLTTMPPAEKDSLIKNSYGVIKFIPFGSELSEPIDIAFPREDDYSRSGLSGVSGVKRDMETRADPNLNINRDLERRDLTINALAINLVNGEIADPFDGVEDLAKREIRAVGDPRERILKEDLSRGFRAVRFACVFNAELERNTKKTIKEIFKPAEETVEDIYGNRPEIKSLVEYEREVREIFNLPAGPLPKCLQVFWDRQQNKPRMAVAREVMSKEIIKAIAANPGRFVELMDEVGGLEIIFPELSRLKNLAQPAKYHREGDAFKHTLLALDNLPPKASLRLKLAALFHDLGKAETQGRNNNGEITFYGHNKISGGLAEKIAKRWRLPAQLAKEAAWLAENHMFPLSSDIKAVDAVKLEKMFLKDEDLGKDLILLAQADALASWSGAGAPDTEVENINILIKRIEEIKKNSGGGEKLAVAPLITGKDLIRLGLKPGILFKELLKEVKKAQLDGRIKNKEEALALVKKITMGEKAGQTGA